MINKKAKVIVYDRKYEIIKEFKGWHAIAEFEKWAEMLPRTAYYHKNKKGSEKIIWDEEGKIKYQVRFV